MKDEIKKILDDEKVIIDQHCNYIIIGNEEYYDLPKRLLDYIGHLKELCDKYEEEHNTKFNEWVFDKKENERLTKGVTLLTNELIDMTKENNRLKEKHKNIIKYLKYQLSQLNFYEDTKAKILCSMVIVKLEEDGK